MDFFPVFLRLDDRQVLVVGGGEVACRKVDLLLKAQANITLVSPQLHPYLQQLVANGRLTYRQKCYQTEDLIGFDQVWATTNQQALNQQIHSDATQRSLWVNVVDNPPLCHFITP
ncbi:bifunctional precorrin-2 dehydrogenase/sirohydrochlorin ferrochelatase, partial [Photobacterium damselae subsp. damselae]|nr:bifunctional precorrin-2 dehydrogenase/sirohydrochlorin ferrochelatase [Photobacterium damselae subsp. damselae]